MSTTTSAPAPRTVAITDPAARQAVAVMLGVHGVRRAIADLPAAVREQAGMSVAVLLVEAQFAVAKSAALAALWPIVATALGSDVRNWTIGGVNGAATEVVLERVAGPGGDAA